MSIPRTYPAEPITVAASFDKFNLDLTISYDGDPIELSDRLLPIDPNNRPRETAEHRPVSRP